MVPLDSPRMQHLVDRLRDTLQGLWSCQTLSVSLNPVIPAQQFYADACLPQHAAKDAYAHNFIGSDLVLRKELADSMPSLLRNLAPGPLDDLLLICPGPVYRERQGAPLQTHHELEIWRLTSHDPGLSCLDALEKALLQVLPAGTRLRQRAGQRPHLVYSRRIEAWTRQGWVRIGFCGVVSPMLLIETGFDSASANALALTLDLERCLALTEENRQDGARYAQDSYL